MPRFYGSPSLVMQSHETAAFVFLVFFIIRKKRKNPWQKPPIKAHCPSVFHSSWMMSMSTSNVHHHSLGTFSFRKPFLSRKYECELGGSQALWRRSSSVSSITIKFYIGVPPASTSLKSAFCHFWSICQSVTHYNPTWRSHRLLFPKVRTLGIYLFFSF